MALLDGKRILVTGVLDPRSIAYAVAELAQQHGAEVLLTSFGRAKRITETAAKRLARPPDVLELDVTSPEDISRVVEEVDRRWSGLDGLVHAVAFAPPSCIGGGFLTAPWPEVATAMHVSTYSLAALGGGFAPLFRSAGGGSIVGLDFDASVAWPSYDWMGVAKAGLESTSRYLARELGPDRVRVNLVAAGPLRTVAARSIDGFDGFEEVWRDRAPLDWDVTDPRPVARTVCALLSDWMPVTTGEIVHADGGAHAIGAAARAHVAGSPGAT